MGLVSLFGDARAYSTYGVRYHTDGRPAEYLGDAAKYTNNPEAWDQSDLFSSIRPCLFKDGKVVGYLQKNDFTKFMDGTPADIYTGNAGDVMIEFPRIGFREGDGVYITTDPGEEYVPYGVGSFHYKPFATPEANSYNNPFGYYADKEYMYIGAYLGSVDMDEGGNTRLRSLAGRSSGQLGMGYTLSQSDAMATANGAGYRLFSHYQRTLLQYLFILRYRSLNSQAVIGNGLTPTTPYTTGMLNQAGMTYGTPGENGPVKLFGIENLWGYYGQWLDGVFFDGTGFHIGLGGGGVLSAGPANNTINGLVIGRLNASGYSGYTFSQNRGFLYAEAAGFACPLEQRSPGYPSNPPYIYATPDTGLCDWYTVRYIDEGVGQHTRRYAFGYCGGFGDGLNASSAEAIHSTGIFATTYIGTFEKYLVLPPVKEYAYPYVGARLMYV